MPRPKKPGAPEPKKRSRNGCWNCKARKVKCGEEHPSCVNCQRTSEECDYSIRLNWDGRKKKNPGYETILFQDPSESSSSSHQPPRRLSEDTSISSTAATPQGTSDHRSPPEDVSPRFGGTNPGPTSEPPSATSTAKANPKFPFPGARVFTAQSAIFPQNDDGEAPLLRSPDLASPMFSLPTSHNATSASPRGYAHMSEASQARGARPPPFKRLRYSIDVDPSHSTHQIESPISLNENAFAAATPRLLSSALAPVGPMGSPLTPAASSPYSDEDGLPKLPALRQAAIASPDIRKMSVNSLLSGPPGPAGPVQYAPPSQRTLNARRTLCLSEVTTYYGLDHGCPDLDLGVNDDANAIRRVRDEPETPAADDASGVSESPRGKGGSMTGPGTYYERPVPVRIPRDLEPLPAKLRDNPMNLLYFHHFISHTAKALVPHDDQQSNPYRHVLPEMAVKNDNLLSLMLAYSAAHRAHLLGHPEPATRIAHWVQDIFPALRRALNDPNQSISNANIATGIMLASLAIVSPTAFGYEIPWQRHLGLARDLIAARQDGIRWTRDWTQEDQVRAFLWSWLAYLDVLGTLSGGRRESSTAWILEYQQDEYEEEWDEIDCIMGITTQAVYVLAKTAELAKECDALRARDLATEVGKTAWKPPKDIIRRAWALENEATTSMARPPQPCKHLHASGNLARWDQREITALNEAFHWAGLVHLHRRVLAKASSHEDVQAAVLKIHACLAQVPLGSEAEASVLFPLFTAACETVEEETRVVVRERIDSIARNGFLQVDKARGLIEEVWRTGRSSDELLTTEFIG